MFQEDTSMRLKLVSALLIAAALVLPTGSFAKHPDKEFKYDEKQDRREAKEQDKAYRKWLKSQGKQEKAWEKADEKERKEYWKAQKKDENWGYPVN
jgi:hypothetical protein